MARGTIRPTKRAESVQRAFSQIMVIPHPPDPSIDNAGGKPIAYRLEDVNGGFDPYAIHCAGWSYGGRTPTADCIGLALWCLGIDRKQPGYKGSAGEWLHCGSLIDDADRDRLYVEPVDHVNAMGGDLLITREHVGVIIRPRIGKFDHLVIDCSPRHGRDTAVGVGMSWSSKCRVLRYKRFV